MRKIDWLFVLFYVWAIGICVNAFYPNYKVKNARIGDPIKGFDLKADSIIVNKKPYVHTDDAYVIRCSKDSMFLLNSDNKIIGRTKWSLQQVGIDSLILNDLWSNE